MTPREPETVSAGGEFDLIRRHFQRTTSPAAPAVALGIGDDCALLQPSPGGQLAISSDMLVEGVHFFPDAAPEALGHKALAVNLSDLAAMGARPLGFTLALALPRVDDAWLTAFSRGLFALADAHACPLVGGDTTRGPLNLCITIFGELRPGEALRRDAAQAGDDLYLSGAEGLDLDLLQGRIEALDAWNWEQRVEETLQRLHLDGNHTPETMGINWGYTWEDFTLNRFQILTHRYDGQGNTVIPTKPVTTWGLDEKLASVVFAVNHQCRCCYI